MCLLLLLLHFTSSTSPISTSSSSSSLHLFLFLLVLVLLLLSLRQLLLLVLSSPVSTSLATPLFYFCISESRAFLVSFPIHTSMLLAAIQEQLLPSQIAHSLHTHAHARGPHLFPFSVSGQLLTFLGHKDSACPSLLVAGLAACLVPAAQSQCASYAK